MEEQPSTGDLLQPTAAGFLGLLKVLWVRVVWAWLPAYSMELKDGTQKKTKHKQCHKMSHKNVILACKSDLYLVEVSQ